MSTKVLEGDQWKAPSSPFLFSHKKMDLQRVRKIQLELVNFTIKIYLHDGTSHSLSDRIKVQNVLNHAAEFNQSRRANKGDSCGGDGGGKEGRPSSESDEDGDIVVIDVNLDPLNTESTFSIPA